MFYDDEEYHNNPNNYNAYRQGNSAYGNNSNLGHSDMPPESEEQMQQR